MPLKSCTALTVVERHDLPVYHPEVRVFEVRDAAGAHLGLFYADFFRRDNKNGGAWMDNLVPQSTLLGMQPIVCNILNLAKPTAGQPVLLSMEEVLTLFHEFGHALHGLFSNQRYPSLSGTTVARDFVELPSLFNEYWALDPKVFANYARHHLTGATIPPALAAKVRETTTFNQGYAMTEILAAATLDLQWHSLLRIPGVGGHRRVRTPRATGGAAQPGRHSSSLPLCILSPHLGQRLRRGLLRLPLGRDAGARRVRVVRGARRPDARERATVQERILSRGNTWDLEEMFRDFRGRDPVIGPMLEFRGLKAH